MRRLGQREPACEVTNKPLCTGPGHVRIAGSASQSWWLRARLDAMAMAGWAPMIDDDDARVEDGLAGVEMDFLRHDSGVRKRKGPPRSGQAHALSARRRPGYSLSGCFPAEPDSASPGPLRLSRPERSANAFGRGSMPPRSTCLAAAGSADNQRPEPSPSF